MLCQQRSVALQPVHRRLAAARVGKDHIPRRGCSALSRDAADRHVAAVRWRRAERGVCPDSAADMAAMRVSARGAVARIGRTAPGWGPGALSGLGLQALDFRGIFPVAAYNLEPEPKPNYFGGSVWSAPSRGRPLTRRTQEERPPVRERDVPPVRTQSPVLGLVARATMTVPTATVSRVMPRRCSVLGRTALDGPLFDLAIRLGHVYVDPRVRIDSCLTSSDGPAASPGRSD